MKELCRPVYLSMLASLLQDKKGKTADRLDRPPNCTRFIKIELNLRFKIVEPDEEKYGTG